MLEVGDRLGGKYTLLQRLGAGGMGEVWLAMQEGSGTFRRRVVVACGRRVVPNRQHGFQRGQQFRSGGDQERVGFRLFR